jgi:riboflavin synthase
VVEFTGTTFTVEATPETMDRTNLTQLRPGSGVNLERAMRLGGKMGGHMVTGHIDGTGRIENVEREGESYLITFQAPAQIMRYIVPKGSVAVDGISLTVAEARGEHFTVSVIPFTYKETTISRKGVGSSVNIECDIIGKYVERLLSAYEVRDAGGAEKTGGIDREFLSKHGFD